MKEAPETAPASIPGIISSILLPYQQAWLEDQSRFKAGLWARQTGKDFSAMAEAALDCMVNPNTLWVVLAPSEKQASESLAKAAYWAQVGDRLNRTAGCRLPASNRTKNEISWTNGSRVLALASRPETARGYSGNVVLTEFAFHEDADEIWRAIYPTITNPLGGGPKKLRIISTPNGCGDRFHQIWTEANEFSRHFITIHDAVKQGLPVNVEELRAGLNDPAGWAQEYECEFRDSGSPVLSHEAIVNCEDPRASESWTETGGDLFVGIDVGRTKHLTVCWTLLKEAGVYWTKEVLVLRNTPMPDQIDQLAPRVARARAVCLDWTGIGTGLGDCLAKQFGQRREGMNGGKVELCVFNGDFKERLLERLCASFESRRVRIPASSAIRKDLHGIHRRRLSTGQMSYHTPAGGDGHSDRCIALALAWRATQIAPPKFQWSPVYDKPRFPRPVWCL